MNSAISFRGSCSLDRRQCTVKRVPLADDVTLIDPLCGSAMNQRRWETVKRRGLNTDRELARRRLSYATVPIGEAARRLYPHCRYGFQGFPSPPEAPYTCPVT